MRFALPLIALALACGSDDATQSITIPVSAVVGSEPFVCGQTYTGLGDGSLELTPTDFRFYVHDVRVVDAEGAEFPVTLEQDGRFQEGDVALLDFEDGCGDFGNPDLNSTIRGTVPEGDYVGLRFRVGVPEARNHADPVTQPAPLNLTDMWWTWNAGYKFIRIDGRSSAFDSWRLHLGSTGCDGDMMGNASCTNANVPEVALDGDPTTLEVAIDLEALVDGSDLANTEETPPGCMSRPDDPDCEALFRNLGLPFAGATPSGQQAFRAYLPD